ncbi:FlgO family outer membrane protein [Geobacter sp. AOG2]|uniref:FlgO family outer membrane protein n=1 Tax=Geobacter sp. AOG2 TaxID=1566347 RepID=UPI001CC3868C|nr:FlgO family outer membrane protein [Geobacter sp. AOG2]GFE60788.1 hypothetical protein AOG2_13760 [Geobacter sp. AOG2]
MIRRFLVAVAGIAITQALTGCATYNSYHPEAYGACYNKTLPVLLDATDLKALFQDIAAELCVDTCAECAARTSDGKAAIPASAPNDEANRLTVLVTDFADLQTFIPNQPGLLMGELMRASLNKTCCYKIIQAEFAKYFKLSESGLVVLTRNVNEIKKDEYFQSEAIVGTYNYLSNNKVVIFVRRINMTTGKISRMVTREVNYSCLGRSLKYSVN